MSFMLFVLSNASSVRFCNCSTRFVDVDGVAALRLGRFGEQVCYIFTESCLRI